MYRWSVNVSRKSDSRGGSHHIIPHSRGGGEGDNIFPDERWPNGILDHPRWHTITENMKPDEVIRKIREHTNGKGNLKERFFSVRFMVSKPWKDKNINPEIKEVKVRPRSRKKKKEAWRMLFRGMNARKAIGWIEREFIRKEWLQSS